MTLVPARVALQMFNIPFNGGQQPPGQLVCKHGTPFTITLAVDPALATIVLRGVAAPLPDSCPACPGPAAAFTFTATLPRGVMEPPLAPGAAVAGTAFPAAASPKAASAAPVLLLDAPGGGIGAGAAANRCSSSLGSCGHASSNVVVMPGCDNTLAMMCSSWAWRCGLNSLVPGGVYLVGAGGVMGLLLPSAVAA